MLQTDACEIAKQKMNLTSPYETFFAKKKGTAKIHYLFL